VIPPDHSAHEGSQSPPADSHVSNMTGTPSTENQLATQAVIAFRARQHEAVGRHQRLIERVNLALGRALTIYITLAIAIAWVAFNLAAPTFSWKVVDPPPFNRLQGAVGLAALLMTTMVLTTQNRQARDAEQRSHLDLQVNLLAEQKVAKLIALIEELRRDLPNVLDRKDALADAMSNAVDPGALIEALSQDAGEPPLADSPSEEAGNPSGP
jgi:uncharacterized membrane protein